MNGPFYAETDGDKSQVNYIACANDHRFSIEVTNRAEAEAGAAELNRVIREVVAATYAAANLVAQPLPPTAGTAEYDEETERMQEAGAALRFYTHDKPNK